MSGDVAKVDVFLRLFFRDVGRSGTGDPGLRPVDGARVEGWWYFWAVSG